MNKSTVNQPQMIDVILEDDGRRLMNSKEVKRKTACVFIVLLSDSIMIAERRKRKNCYYLNIGIGIGIDRCERIAEIIKYSRNDVCRITSVNDLYICDGYVSMEINLSSVSLKQLERACENDFFFRLTISYVFYLWCVHIIGHLRMKGDVLPFVISNSYLFFKWNTPLDSIFYFIFIDASIYLLLFALICHTCPMLTRLKRPLSSSNERHIHTSISV